MNNETETTPASSPATPATPQPGRPTPQAVDDAQNAGTGPGQTRPRPDLASIYPTPAEHHMPPGPRVSGMDDSEVATFAQAGQSMNESVVLITGLLSSACSVLMLYLLKNMWATVICSTLLAVVALVFAFKNHRAGAAMTPMSVIGISAATISIVGSLNILMSQAIIRAMFPY